MNGIYIVIPTYNESENIRNMVSAVMKQDDEYHVIVVDDNSPDGTAEVVEAMKQPANDIRVVKREGKLGIGSAIRDGLKAALASPDCKYIVTLDADFAHDPADIPRLLQERDRADMVQGSRYIKGGTMVGWTWQRILVSRVANFLYRLLLRIPQHEINTYFRVYSRKCAEIVVENTVANKFEFGLESVLVIKDRKLTVCEVPIACTNRTVGKSKLKFSDVTYSIRYLFNIFILRLARNNDIQRFIRFCIVGATGILVNQGLLWLLTDLARIYYLYSAIFSIEASIISNFVLNDLWTFRDRREAAGHVLLRFSKYNLLCAAGSSFNYAILWFCTDILHIYYLISNLIGIAAAVTWNYLISLNWAWVRKIPGAK